MAHHNLDSLDKKILRLIAEDARMPFLEVARVCNVSGAAIHQRIQKLSNQGVLKGSKFNIDPEKIGYETCAFIGINLKHPENFDEVVEKILSSEMMKPGALVIIEHGKDRDYSSHPLFRERRAYGSVNFSIFETSNSQE